ncbi:MAG: sel1 repeat family protein [Lachnospiraceae bacterium]|nr:sel1 repeat family protein [Lachnospiraceae bacterium]
MKSGHWKQILKKTLVTSALSLSMVAAFTACGKKQEDDEIVMNSAATQAPDTRTEMERLLDEANRGDGRAMYELAYIYTYGNEEVAVDYKAANEWIDRANLKGVGDAMNLRGDMYQWALGTPTDLKEALTWYKKAALNGSTTGMVNTGIMYLDGQGVDQDFATALEYFEKAAKAGDAAGMNRYGVMYFNAWGVDQDYAVAFEWISKAAEGGNVSAMRNLAVMYRNGYGVEASPEKGLQWEQMANEAVAAASKTEAATEDDATEAAK